MITAQEYISDIKSVIEDAKNVSAREKKFVYITTLSAFVESRLSGNVSEYSDTAIEQLYRDAIGMLTNLNAPIFKEQIAKLNK